MELQELEEGLEALAQENVGLKEKLREARMEIKNLKAQNERLLAEVDELRPLRQELDLLKRNKEHLKPVPIKPHSPPPQPHMKKLPIPPKADHDSDEDSPSPRSPRVPSPRQSPGRKSDSSTNVGFRSHQRSPSDHSILGDSGSGSQFPGSGSGTISPTPSPATFGGKKRIMGVRGATVYPTRLSTTEYQGTEEIIGSPRDGAAAVGAAPVDADASETLLSYLEKGLEVNDVHPETKSPRPILDRGSRTSEVATSDSHVTSVATAAAAATADASGDRKASARSPRKDDQTSKSPRGTFFSRTVGALGLRGKSTLGSGATRSDSRPSLAQIDFSGGAKSVDVDRPPEMEAPAAPGGGGGGGGVDSGTTVLAGSGGVGGPLDPSSKAARLMGDLDAPVVAPPASVSGPTLVGGIATQAADGRLIISVLSSKKVNKHQFYMLGVSKASQAKQWTITPRRLPDFRDLYAALTKQFGEAYVPPLRSQKITASDKDVINSLQEWVQALAALDPIAASHAFKAFLDPYDNPSAYTASEVLVAKKKGQMSVMVARVWRQHFCVLCNSLYFYRSDDDPAPAGVISLEYVTIELVRGEHKEGGPANVFKIVDLQKGSETHFGVATTKEVGDWILALREAKVNKMGLGYWVKAPGDDEDPLPDTLVRRSKELEEGLAVFRAWVSQESSSFSVIDATPKAFSAHLNAHPIPVNYEQESELNESIWIRDRDDGRPQLMGATKPRLLQLLLDPDYEDEFIGVFLSTYRLVVSSEELFLTLVARYLSREATSAIRSRAFTVLIQWLSMHFSDFSGNVAMSQCVIEFVRHHTEPESDVAQTVLSIVSGHLHQEVSKQWLKQAPKPILPDMYHRQCFDFIDLHPMEVARQLTILEFQLFAAIESRELLNQCWNAEDKEVQAPNVTMTISRFNQMSGWITTLMVKVKEMKPRVALLKRFVDIAHACLELNNFNSVVEIVSALGTTAVRRLTDTWDQLDAETKQVFQEMKDLFETRKNWEHYRNRLSTCSPPCIPYLGLYLTDLVMVDEVHKKKVSHPDAPSISLFNVERLVRISAIHQEVKTFQAVRYCLKPVSYFQEYLMRLDQMSADECYNMSLEIQKKKG